MIYIVIALAAILTLVFVIVLFKDSPEEAYRKYYSKDRVMERERAREEVRKRGLRDE